MEIIYSKIDPKKILHMIHRVDEFYTIKDGHRRDIVAEKEFIQSAAMNMNKGHSLQAHKHIWKPGERECIAQESWVVIKGSVEVPMYDLDGTLIETPILYPGDSSVSLYGGHAYVVLEDDTLVYEYKTGPYKGRENDKVIIGESK